MKTVCMSNCKDPENRSKKRCCCGSHSASDVKKNLNHNSTLKRFLYKQSRKFKRLNYETISI